MIKLAVMPCCEECPDFTPELVDKMKFMGNCITNHEVRCEHHMFCVNVVDFLGKELNKNGKQE